jgi:hypothetical protein
MREKPNPKNVTEEERDQLRKLIRIATQWLREHVK